jgi:outer membrane protein assembly factor BamA
VELGLGYDSRDDEVNPQRGAYHFITARLTPGASVGSAVFYGELSAGMRMFYPFVGEKLVGAAALRGRFLSSGAPFDELALAHLRGVPAGRYHGKAQMAVNLELRSVFARFSMRRQRFGLGAALFVDGGRVWADYRIDETLDGRGPGVHLGSGGGVRVQWGQTRMLRFDAAYSEEKRELHSRRPLSWYLRVNQFF